MEMKLIDKVSYTLLVIGGLLWGLIGFFNYDLLSKITDNVDVMRVVYAVVGLAALYGVYSIVTMMSAQKKSSTKA